MYKYKIIMVNRLKYYWISFQIFLLKQQIAFENWNEKRKLRNLERFVNAQILMSCNYDIEVIKSLNKSKI
jgi:hypothetical protein